IATFPLATSPIEPHLLIPGAPWRPPGKLRESYLQLWYASRLRPRIEGKSAAETAAIKDAYLPDHSYYRFLNEFMAVGEHYFQDFEVDTYTTIKTKVDLLAESGSASKQWLAQMVNAIPKPLLEGAVSYLINTTLIFSNPRQG